MVIFKISTVYKKIDWNPKRKPNLVLFCVLGLFIGFLILINWFIGALRVSMKYCFWVKMGYETGGDRFALISQQPMWCPEYGQTDEMFALVSDVLSNYFFSKQ